MDAAIEDQVKKCHHYQESQKSPAKSPLHLWEWPERAWAQVHVHFAGPFEVHMFLLLVDSHSKWMEVHPIKRADSKSTTQKLRTILKRMGYQR